MRSFAAYVVLVAAMSIAAGIATAVAGECPQGALGVSRTIVVDPMEHARVGSMQYSESLPLNDHEVVLTFDDGPLPPYTSRILDTLASQCVKATFFMVGRMARGYPSLVKRVYAEGHTIGTHSQDHPFTFNKMTVDQAAKQIEDGFTSVRAALGDPSGVAPFFRVPGLLRQASVEQYLAAHGDMTWSVDFVADDWTHIKDKEIVKRAISRIEARGKGILLLHDIQPQTALALPEILSELKAKGFKIVHVVPATPDRPATVTQPELWVARHQHDIWPHVAVVGAEEPEPVLSAPAPANFGIEHFGAPTIKVALAQTFERHVVRDGAPLLPPVTEWPSPAAAPILASAEVLPVPAAYNFRYAHPFRIGGPVKSKLVSRKPGSKRRPLSPNARTRDVHTTGSVPPARAADRMLFGHQLSMRPPTDLTAPQTR